MEFRKQWSDDVKQRTVESPKGVYQVSLEGYFDFNEALAKLMVMNGDMLPRREQFEPGSEDDSDSDFSEPQYDDICDAIEEGRAVIARLEALQSASKNVKDKVDDNSSTRQDNEPVDPVKEVTE